MREPRTENPGLILNESQPGRVAFLPADIDRRFANDNLPDHGDLLTNLIRWAAKDDIPLEVNGHGLVDCELYQQPGRLILHVVNLTSAGSWRAPVHELIAIGPLQMKVRIPADISANQIHTLVSDKTEHVTPQNGWMHFELPRILDHEVVIIRS